MAQLLFTPPGSPAPPLSDNARIVLDKTKKRSAHRLFVEPPLLPAGLKSQYKRVPDKILASGVEFTAQDVDQIIGEHVFSGQLYYFVRFTDGVAHRLLATAFEAHYPNFVDRYKREKADGLLAPFDPSNAFIHLDSRIRNTIRVDMSKLPRKSDKRDSDEDAEFSSLTDLPYTSEDVASDDPYSSYESDGNEVVLRRSNRAATRKKSVMKLPYSPKKTRSTMRRSASTPYGSDDELGGYKQDSPSKGVSAPTRSSNRTRKTIAAITVDSSAYEDSGQEDDDGAGSDFQVGRKPKIAKKKVTPKASRPAYGQIRPITDLDYDDDEETAALRAHRDDCEKCHQKPAHILLARFRKRPKQKGKPRRNSDDEDEEDDEEEKLVNKGGWVRCLKCPVTAHWNCLSQEQRGEILKAARGRDAEKFRQQQARENPGATDQTDNRVEEPMKRLGLAPSESTEFICSSCMRGGICMGCMKVALTPDTKLRGTPVAPLIHESGDVEMVDDSSKAASTSEPPCEETSEEVLFRCVTCKRLAHYEHLPVPSDLQHQMEPGDAVALAEYYQQTTDWQCADCSSYTYKVDKILAWRPYPSDAVEPVRKHGEVPNIKSQLPREYLVKWVDRSYRRAQWVPHMWLASMASAMLKFFLTNGPKVELVAGPLPSANATEDANAETAPLLEIDAEESRDSSAQPDAKPLGLPSDPTLDAELRIPPLWRTVDCVLDVLLWAPHKRHQKTKPIKKKARAHVDSGDEVDEDPHIQAEYAAAFDDGEQPSENYTDSVEDFQKRMGRDIAVEDIDRVIWAFIKWADMGYDECCWDAPPRPGEFGYSAFKAGFERLIASRSVTVPIQGSKSLALVKNRPKGGYSNHVLRDGRQPDLGQASHLKLMPFQIDGFNWLCDNWWNLQHCILADEMGLGKTVQIAAFLGQVQQSWNAWPALVVVPNSTITQWVREFSRWAPGLRVVAFYGGAKGREIVKKYELYHDKIERGTTGCKFHVLVTTYDTVTTGRDVGSVFKNVPRWEVLVVDEGQRLKSDSSLLFKKLKELKCIHRIIMTGTPLNNNIRELFNLMNFLDPDEWNDLEALEKEHAELTEELVRQLHNRLRPYFLRRVKSEVLQLPPKNEVIVPLSMTPLQKNVYRSILSKNFELLKSLTEESRTKVKAVASKANMNNMLMQLRKCLQHPYIYDRAIEPQNLAPQEVHPKLIDGAAKLRFLKSLLPKLKARGHRILLFSQFVIALDVIEDFLSGEGYKFLRLDGNTPQAERQKGMDEFNRPGSDTFIYLLSTRAGGVGINLWSADTVIIHDPDFNPHQDLQAIARSHRYGQTKTCLVFKLMVKDSAEERIIQTGKKKLILDHLIVQKMDEDESTGEDLQSILTYGAKALFEDGHEAKDIVYTDHDIDTLIEKTETEEPQPEVPKEGGFSFSFAKIWAADKDALEEVTDDLPRGPGLDSWAQTLQRIETEKLKEKQQEVSGRGVRRKAAATFHQQPVYVDLPPDPVPKKRRKSKSAPASSDESDVYMSSIASSDSSSTDEPAPVSMQEDLQELQLAHATYRSTFQVAAPTATLTTASKVVEPTTAPITGQFTVTAPLAAPVPTTALAPNATPATSHMQRVAQSHVAIRDGPARAGISDTNNRCGLCGLSHGPGRCTMTESSENLVEYRYMLLMHADHEPIQERRRALRAIDETLSKRGKIHLVAGQPLLIVERPAAAVGNTIKSHQSKAHNQRKGDSVDPPRPPRNQIQTSVAPPSIGMKSQVTANPFWSDPFESSAQSRQQPVAGPSKRPSSSITDPQEVVKKKARVCELGCGQPSHRVKDCPVVKAGTASIEQAIKRHDSNPAMADIVGRLRKILDKQKRAEPTPEEAWVDYILVDSD